MKFSERLIGAVGGAAVVGIAFYFLLKWIFDKACDLERYSNYSFNFDMAGSAALLAVGVFAIFSAGLFVLIDGIKYAKKTEKVVLLSLIGWCLIWIGYVVFSGFWCSQDAWRTYAVILLLPLSFGVLVLVGGRWLNDAE